MENGGTPIGEARPFPHPPRETLPAAGRASERETLQGPAAKGFERTLQARESVLLFADLDEAAERLFRYPSRKDLEAYREAVGRLLEKAQERIELCRDYSFPASAARVYLVERTRECLRELERVLRREAGRTRILGLTEEIRGCLLSLSA
ncbi:MAG: DUF327 family protein [Synergistales bacterium]